MQTMRERVSPIVVIVSADAEWAPVKSMLKPGRIESTPYGEAFTHQIVDTPVRFLHGGWAKISAAASAEYAIATWQPEVLINLGTCGGIEGRIARGEKVLVTRTLAYDIREGIADPDEAIRAYTTDIDVSWLDDLPIALRRVTLLSADRDLVPSEVPELVRRYGAVAADWESAAIAYVARRRGTRLLIIRGVSDLVNAASGEAIGALALYSDRAAAVMRSLLDDLTVIVPHVLRRVGR